MRIKLTILPYDTCNIEECLEQLVSSGFIIRYQAGDQKIIQIVNFSKHQKPHPSEAGSVFPPLGADPQIRRAAKWTYFVRAGDDGPIKIGSAVSPVDRLVTLQTGNHVNLIILGVVATPEKEIQNKFKKDKLRHEWFVASDDLLSFIKAEALDPHEVTEESFFLTATSEKNGTAPEILVSEQEKNGGNPSSNPYPSSLLLNPESLILIPEEAAAPPGLENASLAIGDGARAGDGGVGEGEKSPPPGLEPTPPRKKRVKVITPGFDEFWAIYPRKTAKDDARKRWLTLKPNEELQAKIIAAVEAQSKLDRWSDPNYIPHAATWLNGKRWEDEINGRQSSGGVGSTPSRLRAAPGKYDNFKCFDPEAAQTGDGAKPQSDAVDVPSGVEDRQADPGGNPFGD